MFIDAWPGSLPGPADRYPFVASEANLVDFIKMRGNTLLAETTMTVARVASGETAKSAKSEIWLGD